MELFGLVSLLGALFLACYFSPITFELIIWTALFTIVFGMKVAAIAAGSILFCLLMTWAEGGYSSR